jgi:hypothetical protein
VLSEDIQYRRNSILVEGVVVAHEPGTAADSGAVRSRIRFRLPAAEGGLGPEQEIVTSPVIPPPEYALGERVPIYVASYQPLEVRVDPWGVWVFLAITVTFWLIAWFWPVRR